MKRNATLAQQMLGGKANDLLDHPEVSVMLLAEIAVSLDQIALLLRRLSKETR